MSQRTPTRLARLDGSEQFRETAKSVSEFWQWAMGDLTGLALGARNSPLGVTRETAREEMPL
jgi:hypothetical protein